VPPGQARRGARLPRRRAATHVRARRARSRTRPPGCHARGACSSRRSRRRGRRLPRGGAPGRVASRRACAGRPAPA
jgi:hypothetical protein